MSNDLEAYWSTIRLAPLPPTFESVLDERGSVLLLLGTAAERRKALEYVSGRLPPSQGNLPNRLPCVNMQCARAHFISAQETLYAASRHYSDTYLGKPLYSPAHIPLLPYTIARIVASAPLGGSLAEGWLATKGLLVQFAAQQKSHVNRVAISLARWVTGGDIEGLPDLPIIDRALELFLAAESLGMLHHVWLTFDGLHDDVPIEDIRHIIDVLGKTGSFTFLLGCTPEQRELALTIHPTPKEYLVYAGAFHEVGLDAS